MHTDRMQFIQTQTPYCVLPTYYLYLNRVQLATTWLLATVCATWTTSIKCYVCTSTI